MIIESYINEARDRRKNMFDIISKTLENEFVSYPNKTAVIKWKTKFLMIKLSEIEDVRIVEDIDIR